MTTDPVLPVKGVTFDLDDTLWCGKTVILNANRHFHAYLETHTPALTTAFPPQAFDRLLAQFQKDLPDKAHDYTFLRMHTLRHCIAHVGEAELNLLEEQALEDFVNNAFQAFLIPRSQPELFEGVEQLLQQLYQHLSVASISEVKEELNAISNPEKMAPIMGVITNGNCLLETLPPFFQERMNFMISAESVGRAKPAIEIFDAAMAKFPSSYERAHIVHIGDHYDFDVVGAKKAGFRTIWINAKWTKPDVLRKQDFDPEDADRYSFADAVVKDVKRVLDVVKLWNEEARGP